MTSRTLSNATATSSRAVLDQFYCSRGKAVELGATNHPTKILEQATDLVLDIALDLH